MTKSELAARYFPEVPISVACQRLRRLIRDTPGLLLALEAKGYRRRQRNLTVAQVRVIAEYIGPADEPP